MNELNILENKLDNLLDQYEAINIDSNDMGIKELSQMIESFDSVKDADWNYDESHSELTEEERTIIDRITDTVYDRVNALNRILESKNTRYLESGRETIEIRRELREIQKRIEKNEAIVNVQRGPELEKSESFMKLYNDSLKELESDRLRVTELNSRKASLYRTMRDLQYGVTSPAVNETREVAHEETRSEEVKPISAEPEREEVAEPLPEPLPEETPVVPVAPVTSEVEPLPAELDAPREETAEPLPEPLPEELPEELPAENTEEDEKSLNGPIPVPVGGVSDETEPLPEPLPEETTEPEQTEPEEEEDEVVSITNPKPSLWKKIGDVLKKAAVFVVAIATLGTAYHTGHTDSDIHKLNDTATSINETLTDMNEREDLDLDEDEDKDKDDVKEEDED